MNTFDNNVDDDIDSIIEENIETDIKSNEAFKRKTRDNFYHDGMLLDDQEDEEEVYDDDNLYAVSDIGPGLLSTLVPPIQSNKINNWHQLNTQMNTIEDKNIMAVNATPILSTLDRRPFSPPFSQFNNF